MSQPFLLSSALIARFTVSLVGDSGACSALVFPSSLLPVFNRNCEYAFEGLLNGPIPHGVDQFAPAQGQQALL